MGKEIIARAPERVWFQLLGPVRAYVDGETLDLGSLRERRMLVALLLSPGGHISRGQLAEWIWDDVPEDRLNDALYEIVSDLRGRLNPAGLGGKLVSKDGWYHLDIDPTWVDLHQFETIVERARVLEDADQRDMLVNALGLRAGEPLGGIDGTQIDGVRARLQRRIRDVELSVNQIDLRVGHSRERIADLDRLFRAAPDDMRAAGLYMYALHQLGRTIDALTIYDQHRQRMLADGLDVSEKLDDLQKQILRNESDLGPVADFFLGGRPVSPAHSSGKESADENAERAGQDNKDTTSSSPVGTVGNFSFNAPVTANDQTVFGIRIGRES